MSGGLVTRVLELDGELYLVLARGPWGLVARRLRGDDRARVERALDNTHAELEAVLIGGMEEG